MGSQVKQVSAKRFPCLFCQKSFVARNLLEVHLNGHTREEPYNCHLCDKTYKSGTGLKQHCPASFQLTHEKNRHLAISHGIGVSVTCPICNKPMSGQYALEAHMRKHTQERPFKCSFCFKTYLNIGSLKRHEGFHTDVKPYICKICGISFTHWHLLETHKGEHNGKLHQCSECSSSFRERCNLLAHIRNVHKNERRFACIVCGKRFQTSSKLRRHTFTHSNEQPFKCDHCGERFKYQESFKSHLKRHSMEKL
ncbi:putative zinc finger protein [Orchesella cincta]|uniref:Putative zinc finger protein n=1 Tax=Orchesella cincta TaxID=48709 RepID=A0A1D2MKQ1_ORCCI|nr:putative zinc finger protein [Orchesella cincta]